MTSVPRSEFDERVHPEMEMIRSNVGPDIPDLLLTRAPYFLDVVKVLLDRRSVGEGLQDLLDAGVRIGAEEGEPAMFLLDQHDPDHSANRAVGCQECLVRLGALLVVQRASEGLPTARLAGSLGQADPVLSVDPRSTTTSTLAWFLCRRQAAQMRAIV